MNKFCLLNTEIDISGHDYAADLILLQKQT